VHICGVNHSMSIKELIRLELIQKLIGRRLKNVSSIEETNIYLEEFIYTHNTKLGY